MDNIQSLSAEAFPMSKTFSIVNSLVSYPRLSELAMVSAFKFESQAASRQNSERFVITIAGLTRTKSPSSSILCMWSGGGLMVGRGDALRIGLATPWFIDDRGEALWFDGLNSKGKRHIFESARHTLEGGRHSLEGARYTLEDGRAERLGNRVFLAGN